MNAARLAVCLGLLLVALGVAQVQPKAVEKCTVVGRVVTLSGEPLKSARVALVQVANREQPRSYRAVTDVEGAFVIENIAPGQYRFTATRNGFVSQEYKPEGGGDGAILTLHQGQQEKDVLFRLVRAAAVVGRVVDEDGEPLAGVEVEALVKAGDSEDDPGEGIRIASGELVPASIAMTNDLGEYRLYGLPPGEYYFSAVDSGDPHLSDYMLRSGGFGFDAGNEPKSNHPPLYYPGVLQRSQAQSLTVPAGGEIRVDFALASGKTMVVTGRVVGAGGKPASGAWVTIMPRDLETLFTSLRNAAQVDSDGRFRVDGITPGTYVVTASQTLDDKQYSAQQKIEVGTEEVSVQLFLSKGATLFGKVVAQGQPSLDYRKLNVWLRSADEDLMSGSGAGSVKQDGSFTISNLAESTYRVAVSQLPDGWYLRSARLGSEDVFANGLKVSKGMGSASLELTVSPTAALLQGTVVNDMKPVAGASVRIEPDRENPYRRDLLKSGKTDQYGQFVFKNVAPGTYVVTAAEDDGQGHSKKSKPLKVTVAESERKTVKLEIAPEQH